MFTLPTTVRLADRQVDDAVAVLARAFFDDPLFVYVEPDDERRLQLMPQFLSVGTRYGMLFGEVHTTDTRPLGGAVWLPPRETEVLPERLDAAGMGAAAEAAGDAAMQRFGAFMELGSELHQRDMSGPHWYLMVLGVDPPLQGKGIGGALLQPVLERADREGLPCYLETAKERNVPFYQRHGFRVLVDTTLPGGPRLWTMAREPGR